MPSPPLGLVVLGSTGSIGVSTLDVVRNLGPERVRVVGLAAGSKWDKLAEQARALRPKFVSVAPGEPYRRAKEALAGVCQVLEGEKGQ